MIILINIKGGVDPILDLAWSPVDNVFATAEKRGVTFWTYDGGLSSKKGVFGSNKMCAMATVAFDKDGRCFSGSSEGSVYVWNGTSCMKSVSVTTGLINSICVTDGKILVGGKDTISVFDSSLKKTSSIAVGAQVRAIDTHGGNILTGLRDGSIVEIDGSGNKKTLMQSHSDGEVWGLSIDAHTGLVNKVLSSCSLIR